MGDPKKFHGGSMSPDEFVGNDFANTGGARNDGGKLRYDLVPPEVERALAEVLTEGAKKYADRNWEGGMSYQRVYASLRRHLVAWEQGNNVDLDLGLNHMKMVLCNAAFLVTYIERGMTWLDDRPACFTTEPGTEVTATIKQAQNHTGHPCKECE